MQRKSLHLLRIKLYKCYIFVCVYQGTLKEKEHSDDLGIDDDNIESDIEGTGWDQEE